LLVLSSAWAASSNAAASPDPGGSIKSETLEQVAAQTPGKTVQLNLRLRPDVTPEQAANLVQTFRIAALRILFKKNETQRSGLSVSLTFSSLGPTSDRQLARAKCILLVPDDDSFTDPTSRAVSADQLHRWRSDGAIAYASAIDALRLEQTRPEFVKDVKFPTDTWNADQMVEAIVAGLGKKWAVAGGGKVPAQCAEFVVSVPSGG
jgi:hypothetical protein